MKRIYRSQEDRIIAGVSGGFAEYLGIDSTIVRLIWIFFTVFGGLGIIAYIFSIILISEKEVSQTKEIEMDDDHDEKLVLWGVVIIIVGILLFFRHQPMVGMMWHTVGGNWFNILFAIALIGIGIYIFLSRKEDDGNSLNNIRISGLFLSETDKKIAGVCGGIAKSVNIDSTIIRLIWVLGTLLSAGIGIILYIICMLVFSKSTDDIVETK
ncbi:MAG: PspC domain-containing protein [Candidatus Neomarinimicrobiota bacterium]